MLRISCVRIFLRQILICFTILGIFLSVERSADVLGKITDPINRPGGALIKAADNTLLMLSQEIYLFRMRTVRINL
jgi:hypothetical protein